MDFSFFFHPIFFLFCPGEEIHIYVCVGFFFCVCVCIHTHTHIYSVYRYIYIYISHTSFSPKQWRTWSFSPKTLSSQDIICEWKKVKFFYRLKRKSQANKYLFEKIWTNIWNVKKKKKRSLLWSHYLGINHC